MTMMRSRVMRDVAAAGITVLAAAGLASCGDPALPAGPFAEPRQPAVQCEPLAGHKLATFGDVAVRNSGTATAVIDRVGLARMRGGLRLLRTLVVPTTQDIEGMHWGLPPRSFQNELAGWQWDRRHAAAGARVPPAAGKLDQANLLLIVALTPGARRGSAAGIKVWYHVGGSDYQVNIPLGLTLVNRKSCG